MASLIETLRARKGDWTKNPRLAPLDQLFANAASFIGATSTKRAELERQGTLTPKGIADVLRDFADKGPTPELRRTREKIDQVKADLKTAREQLARPKIDPSDVAAAMLRQEMRGYLRSLSPSERAGVLLSGKDPALLAAALEAPDALSGLTPDVRAKAVDINLELHHAAEVATFAETEDGLELLETMVRSAEMDIQAGIGRPVAA
jgi:hypothetical protein